MLFFLVTPCSVVVFQPYMEWISTKKKVQQLFFQFFRSFMRIWSFQEKSHFRLYLKSSKQWVYVFCNLYLINQFHFDLFQKFGEKKDWCQVIFFFLFRFLLSSILQLPTNIALRRKYLTLLHASETYIIFLCLLSFINYWPVSIDINV